MSTHQEITIADLTFGLIVTGSTWRIAWVSRERGAAPLTMWDIHRLKLEHEAEIDSAVEEIACANH